MYQNMLVFVWFLFEEQLLCNDNGLYNRLNALGLMIF